MLRRLQLSLFVFLLQFTIAKSGWASDSNVGFKRTALLDSLGKTRVGETVPWFASEISPGKILNRTSILSQAKEKGRHGIALVFFATWCVPCRAGIKELGRNRDRLDSAGVEVFLMDYSEDGKSAPDMLDKLGAKKFTVLPDRYGMIGEDFGVVNAEKGGGLPKTFVAGTDGRIRAIFSTEGDDYINLILEACQ